MNKKLKYSIAFGLSMFGVVLNGSAIYYPKFRIVAVPFLFIFTIFTLILGYYGEKFMED